MGNAAQVHDVMSFLALKTAEERDVKAFVPADPRAITGILFDVTPVVLSLT